MIQLTVATVFLLTATAHAGEIPRHCFDFEKKIDSPVPLLDQKPIPPSSEWEKGISALGKTNEIDWAYTSGTVKKPVSAIYQKLLDPKTIRGEKGPKVEMKELKSQNFMKLFEESINAKPTFFISLDWIEKWAYRLKEGTEKDPKEIQIFYEKMSGTNFIDHFCGNILLKALSPDSTSVFLYEEIKASHRDSEDVLKGITGTLNTLRK